MSRPLPVQSRLSHVKTQMLSVVAAPVFSVVMVSRLFGISRNTFYQYRHQAEQGSLASFDGTPRVHGSAQPQRMIDAVWRAPAPYPSFGKPRLAHVLYHPGIRLSPPTVQRIVPKDAPWVPPVTGPRRPGNAFAALAPQVMGAMARCSRYTNQPDGFDRYVMTILDDPSRPVIARGLSAPQTVAEVVEGRQAAVLT